MALGPQSPHRIHSDVGTFSGTERPEPYNMIPPLSKGTVKPNRLYGIAYNPWQVQTIPSPGILGGLAEGDPGNRSHEPEIILMRPQGLSRPFGCTAHGQARVPHI